VLRAKEGVQADRNLGAYGGQRNLEKQWKLEALQDITCLTTTTPTTMRRSFNFPHNESSKDNRETNPALQDVAAGSPGGINPAPVLDNLREFLSPKGGGGWALTHLRRAEGFSLSIGLFTIPHRRRQIDVQ